LIGIKHPSAYSHLPQKVHKRQNEKGDEDERPNEGISRLFVKFLAKPFPCGHMVSLTNTLSQLTVQILVPS
jgi:hypothetical protein